MKRLSLIAVVLVIISCKDNDDASLTTIPELSGTWLLVEQYSDPGDGSGDFMKVKSEKTIEFLNDGTFRSNGKLCSLDSSIGPKTTGIYAVNESLTKYSQNNYLEPEGCEFENLKVGIYLRGSDLILSYPCFEGCQQKFKKE